MNNTYTGIKAVPGISCAKALVLDKREVKISNRAITKSQAEDEKRRFTEAVRQSETQINGLINSAKTTFGEENAAIFEAHLDILNDPVLEEAVFSRIENENKNAELALSEAADEISAMFLAIDDAYLRERVEDVKDVCGRVLRNMQGIMPATRVSLNEDVIIVAKNLTPSDTVSLDLKKVKGFVTDEGGATAHTVILAKTHGIPAVVGMGSFSGLVKDGDFLIIDGANGTVFLNPDMSTVDEYELKKSAYENYKKSLDALIDLPAETADGRRLELSANIGSAKDIEKVLENNADGIGLFRTEFLYMENTHFPTEDEQFQAYKEAAQAMRGKPVIIRTLDIGGDKELSYYKFDYEMNPFLGYRAIRLCLDKTDIFKTQLRAILRASAFGKIRIMLPMIISVSEVRQSKEILKECMSELACNGTAFDKNIEVGIMTETPAAVLTADTLAKECDFFSIGTNDLTQYTLAADRGNEKISRLYDSFNPAVLLSIKHVIDAAHKNGKWAGMCGEMASDERAVPLLIGLGLDEFSVNASSLLSVKDIIRKSDYQALSGRSGDILALDTADEIKGFLDKQLIKEG